MGCRRNIAECDVRTQIIRCNAERRSLGPGSQLGLENEKERGEKKRPLARQFFSPTRLASLAKFFRHVPFRSITPTGEPGQRLYQSYEARHTVESRSICWAHVFPAVIGLMKEIIFEVRVIDERWRKVMLALKLSRRFSYRHPKYSGEFNGIVSCQP